MPKLHRKIQQGGICSMKAGDKSEPDSSPPNLREEGDTQTRMLFEKCSGQSFVVVGVESIEGVAKLDVGLILWEEYWKH